MQVSTRILPLLATVLMTADYFLVPTKIALAQASPGNAQPSQNQPSQDIPDQKLDAVASALQHVMVLQQDYQQRISAAAPADKQRIAEEANGALVKAVTDQGLTVPEYNSILEVAQNDSSVRDKLLRRVQPPANQPPENQPLAK